MADKKPTKKKKVKVMNVVKLLNEPLPEEAIKQREGGGGRMLDYLEGWWVKKNANRIFGVGNWDYTPVFDQMKHIPLPPTASGKTTGLYTVPVNLTVRIVKSSTEVETVVRSDIGVTQYYGELSKEMAIKGCVTDGLKRCLSSFGEQFGLGLYDKGNGVPETAEVATPTRRTAPTSQEALIEKFGLPAGQQPPTCPKCNVVMRLVARKDGSGVFWGCPNWRQGCKTIFNTSAVGVDGLLHAQAPKEPAPEDIPEAENIPADSIPF